ncbi:MAG: uracil-DNA glycosylase family protein [Oceanibaculum nanhaiense]|jgi:uracil-DNA glycosylase|uniref:uracil-DNA glycosylase family protein n=1 Tax=Oceanibaculum nanhaiense TaxID=1909734 RepID=UPI0032EE069C
MVGEPLPALLREIEACRLCEAHLPLGPRPVIRAAASARILVIGQAPGTKVHRTGIPFNDPSGDRLRDWMGIDRDIFYDETRIAIMPMGLCYPGRNARGGDLPPRPECAPLWHHRVLALLPEIELTLLIGAYAQARYLGEKREKTLAGTVARWREFGPAFIPTPHPSPRNRNWLKTHPWFEDEVVPEIRRRVAALV